MRHPNHHRIPDVPVGTKNPNFPVGTNSSGIDPITQEPIRPALVGSPPVPQMQAPGTVWTHDESPESAFTATVKAYFAPQDDNEQTGDANAHRMLVYVPNDQWSNAVFLKDLCEPIRFRYRDSFGNEFTFRATFKLLTQPHMGFAYPYPCDAVLQIHGSVDVINRCDREW